MTKLTLNIFSGSDIDQGQYKKIRDFKIKKNELVECYFCNEKFNKYLYLTKQNIEMPLSFSNSVVACKICYNINQFTPSMFNNYVIAKSNIKQELIVSKTITFIKKNGRIPVIKEIDSDAKNVKLSITEYFDVIRMTNYKVLPDELKNIKVFVNLNIDLGFLGIKKEVFAFDDSVMSDEVYEEYTKENNIFTGLKNSDFDKETIDFLNNHFYGNVSTNELIINELMLTDESIKKFNKNIDSLFMELI